MLEGLCEQNPQANVICIDGLSAFDQLSRAAMLDGLLNVANCGAVLPFVRMFYGGPSSYLWEDSAGTVHTIRQGEGGEQGDALMPLSFCTGATQRFRRGSGRASRGRGAVGVP